MANWNFCRYTLLCKDAQEAEAIASTISEWLTLESPEGINWQLPWIGLVALGSGIAKWENGALNPDYKYGGCFEEEPEVSDNIVLLSTQWKWEPHHEIMVDCINKMWPNVELLYSSELDNADDKLTNDESLVGEITIDCWSSDDKEFFDLIESTTGLSKGEALEKLKFLSEQDWYISGADREDMEKLAEVLVPKEIRDSDADDVGFIMNTYSEFLKLSAYEFLELPKPTNAFR